MSSLSESDHHESNDANTLTRSLNTDGQSRKSKPSSEPVIHMASVNKAIIANTAEYRTANMTQGECYDQYRSVNRASAQSRMLLLLIAIPAIIALAFSSYLAYISLTSSSVAGCSGGLFDCETVMKTRWGVWLGIPVGILAVVTYLGLLVSLGLAQIGSAAKRKFFWLAVKALCLSAGAAAIWFVYLQFFVLDQLCKYCLVAHACGLFLASIVMIRSKFNFQQNWIPGTTALAGLAVLIIGQKLGPEPVTHVIQDYPDQAVSTPAENMEFSPFAAPMPSDDLFDGEFEPPIEDFIIEPPADVEVTMTSASYTKSPTLFSTATLLTACLTYQPSDDLPAETSIQDQADQEAIKDESEEQKERSPDPKPVKRLARIQGGNIKLNVDHWPLTGNKNAKYIFVEMFDYACPHCRETHQNAVSGAKKIMGNELAIIVLPLPLNTRCNNAISKTGPLFGESCEISKLAVAVWRIDRDKFSEFHDWMFEGQTPNYAAAKAHAETLVNQARLAKELASPVAAAYLGKHVEIYKRIGKGNIPKLMFPTTSIIGKFSSAEALVETIRKQGPVMEVTPQ